MDGQRSGRTTPSVRTLGTGDWDALCALWAGYLAFFVALGETERCIGSAHCVVRATTWSRQPTCCLEDLFVAPAARGHEVGRTLLAAVNDAALRDVTGPELSVTPLP